MNFCRSSIFVLSLSVLVMSGCQNSANPEQRLIGTWELDTAPMKEAMKKDMVGQMTGKDDPASEMGNQMMNQMLANMNVTMEFKADGETAFSSSMMGNTNTEQGTWKLVSADGNKLTISVSSNGNDPQNGTVTFIDDDTIELDPPENQPLPPGMDHLMMKRVKQ